MYEDEGERTRANIAVNKNPIKGRAYALLKKVHSLGEVREPLLHA